MTHTLKTTQLVAALVFAAGAASPLAAQNNAVPPTNAHQHAAASAQSFHHASDLLKADIVDSKAESVGGVRDVLFDRGSGRIEFVLLKVDTPGIGGKVVAIPYSRFGHDAKEKRLTLGLTEEELKAEARTLPDDWKERPGTAWADDLNRSGRVGVNTPAIDNEEATAIAIAAATEEAVKGRIIAVRRDVGQNGEEVVAVVRTAEGETRDLTLGPSWFIMSHDAAPMRGDEIEAQIRSATIEGAKPRSYISSATIGGDRIVIRDDKARPVWRRGATGDSAAIGRLMLLSKLVGATARAMDQDGGEIQDAIFEWNSGRIALLCFDPNDNVLGLADTIRCVPWQVSSVGPDGKVRFDADKDMIVAAAEMPDDLSAYSSGNQLRAAYAAFNIEPPVLRPIDRTTTPR